MKLDHHDMNVVHRTLTWSREAILEKIERVKDSTDIVAKEVIIMSLLTEVNRMTAIIDSIKKDKEF